MLWNPQKGMKSTWLQGKRRGDRESRKISERNSRLAVHQEAETGGGPRIPGREESINKGRERCSGGTARTQVWLRYRVHAKEVERNETERLVVANL